MNAAGGESVSPSVFAPPSIKPGARLAELSIVLDGDAAAPSAVAEITDAVASTVLPETDAAAAMGLLSRS